MSNYKIAVLGDKDSVLGFIMAGRMAGLDGETIRSRLRATYV